jgi:phage tail-like protein
MAVIEQTAGDQLLRYLPAIFQEDRFLADFLRPFENLWLESDVSKTDRMEGNDEDTQAIEHRIAHLDDYFDPEKTRDRFLEWLAGWVAVTLHARLSKSKQRQFIANAVQYYRRRGTKKNLEALLNFFTDGQAVVRETDAPEFQIGVHSTIGIDTYIGDRDAFYFQVDLTLPGASDDIGADRRQSEDLARAVIDAEKPAHTDYHLQIYPRTDTNSRSAGVGPVPPRVGPEADATGPAPSEAPPASPDTMHEYPIVEELG